MSELPSNKFKLRILLFLACVDIYRITFKEQIPTTKTYTTDYIRFLSPLQSLYTDVFFLLENRRAHDHDPVALVTSFATPIFDFEKVISATTISNSAPSLVKTSLTKN